MNTLSKFIAKIFGPKPAGKLAPSLFSGSSLPPDIYMHVYLRGELYVANKDQLTELLKRYEKEEDFEACRYIQAQIKRFDHE